MNTTSHKQNGVYGPNAEDIMTGAPAYREFTSETNWVNKARTWMQEGDLVFDRFGQPLRNGGEFMDATAREAYPAVILRKIGKAAAGRLLDGVLHHAMPGVSDGA